MNNTYVLLHNDVDRNPLGAELECIEGKTPKEALKNRFGINFSRVNWDNAYDANIILAKGHLSGPNTIRLKSRFMRLCFKIAK